MGEKCFGSFCCSLSSLLAKALNFSLVINEGAQLLSGTPSTTENNSSSSHFVFHSVIDGLGPRNPNQQT